MKAENVLDLLKRQKILPDTIAEIGCGSAEILVQLSKKMPNRTKFWGYDISPQAIEIAKKKENKNLKVELKDITQSPSEHSYELVLVMDVIEHLENYFEFLDKIKEIGKHTVFHIPLDMCMWSLFREGMLLETKSRIGHIHNFTEDFILSVLQDYGYKVLDKKYTPPSFKHKSVKQRIVNVFRKILFVIAPRFCTKTIGGYSIMVLVENSESD
jgi:ubiquinone/menaquinone biosynthesis C-methylase UbiE